MGGLILVSILRAQRYLQGFLGKSDLERRILQVATGRDRSDAIEFIDVSGCERRIAMIYRLILRLFERERQASFCNRSLQGKAGEVSREFDSLVDSGVSREPE